jgi:hypothetical protein
MNELAKLTEDAEEFPQSGFGDRRLFHEMVAHPAANESEDDSTKVGKPRQGTILQIVSSNKPIKR